MPDYSSPNSELILSSQQMADADSYTIKEKGVTGEQLMERAGEAFLKEVFARKSNIRSIAVLCGKGNNGGDGFVIARRAHEFGINVSVIVFCNQGEIKGDAKIALDKCLKSNVAVFDTAKINEVLNSVECVVDALYGIKFRGSLSNIEKRAAQLVNDLRNTKKIYVACVDLPSGSICDTGMIEGESFNCDLTVTFQAFKPLHFCFPAAKFCGERVVVDIGIEAESHSTAKLITPKLFSESLLTSSSGYKGTRGHLIVVAGSPGHSGAAALTSRAGLRAGAGLLTLYSDTESCKIAVEFTPEIMTSEVNDSEIEKISAIKKGALVIGPGLELNSKVFRSVLDSGKHLPKVIDASAIRILSNDLAPDLLENAVLTPHPGEMAALLDCSIEEILADRFGSVRAAANKCKCTVILKGPYSLIASHDGKVLVSPFANSNLGTAGSGDVLSGLIGGLLAKGMAVESASSLGVYLHGQIGSALLPNGIVGSLASEFADHFPTALADVVSNGSQRTWKSIPAVI